MDEDEASLPGMSLQDYLEATETSYSAFARLVPCSIGYPRMLAQGIAWPSYKMACRIEKVTNGAVPRTRWYPAGEDITSSDIPIEDLEI